MPSITRDVSNGRMHLLDLKISCTKLTTSNYFYTNKSLNIKCFYPEYKSLVASCLITLWTLFRFVFILLFLLLCSFFHPFVEKMKSIILSDLHRHVLLLNRLHIILKYQICDWIVLRWNMVKYSRFHGCSDIKFPMLKEKSKKKRKKYTMYESRRGIRMSRTIPWGILPWSKGLEDCTNAA